MKHSFFVIVAMLMPVPLMAQTNERSPREQEVRAVRTPEKRNSLSLTLEGVNRYHGSMVGEIFEPAPAPRAILSLSHRTPYGTWMLNSWNSAGSGFNAESDLGAAFRAGNVTLSYTHFAIRGGDLTQLGISLSSGVSVGARVVPLAVDLRYYFGQRPNSPPGGTVLKVSSGGGHRLPGLVKDFQLRHRLALGIDSNPFRLGTGVSAIGFYSVELGYKKAYVSWSLSQPVAGRDNTTRGFRQSIAGGYRYNLAW